jgi:LPS O-antigen subunit length determinant protein (WzzB/FepE family)
LRTIQSFGITNYTSQAKALNDAYINALKNGNNSQILTRKKKLNVLERYGADYLTITELLKNETERLSLLNGKLAEAKVNANQKLPHKFLVKKAYPAEKKSYPGRWLIVAISTIVTFVFSILLLLFIDRYKDLLKFK